MYFNGLHLRLNSLYDCNCEHCKSEKINLSADSDEPLFKSVLKAAEKAFKHLHEKGSYKPEDITEKTYQKLIDETYKVFDFAIRDNEIPEEMLAKLQNDAFIFSGLKTHAQLMEASSMLLDDEGKIRSFESFAHDFNKINKNYNQNYLEAEHQFAVSSSQSAANWASIDQDGRYHLQYRTANDDRVRDSHRVLHNVTLPADDIFWFSYYPPNGWRCRCVAVEVLKDKYKLSDSEKSVQLGEKATSQIGKDGKNKLEIFRFNPGAEQKVFPPKHPYNKVKGANIAKKQFENLEKSFVPQSLRKFLENRSIDVDEGFFKLFKKEINFELSKGTAEYHPYYNRVKIPNYKEDYRIKKTIYHEFGHALDAHNDFYKNKKTIDLMKSYINRTDYHGFFKKLDEKAIKSKVSNANDLEQKAALRDTIMSLNLNYGAGHTKAYFTKKGAGNRQKEFLAHAFENKFVGNDLFKKEAPELYNDMIKLVDDLISEIK